MIVWRNWTSVISRFFLASLSCSRGLSVLKFLSSGCVRLNDRFEVYTGLKVENTLLVSRLLLLKPMRSSAPVWNGCPTPKFHRSDLVFTVAPPEKRFVPLVSVELFVSVANRNG